MQTLYARENLSSTCSTNSTLTLQVEEDSLREIVRKIMSHTVILKNEGPIYSQVSLYEKHIMI